MTGVFGRRLSSVFPSLSTGMMGSVGIFHAGATTVVYNGGFSRRVPDCGAPIPNLCITGVTRVCPSREDIGGDVGITLRTSTVLEVDWSLTTG